MEEQRPYALLGRARRTTDLGERTQLLRQLRLAHPTYQTLVVGLELAECLEAEEAYSVYHELVTLPDPKRTAMRALAQVCAKLALPVEAKLWRRKVSEPRLDRPKLLPPLTGEDGSLVCPGCGQGFRLEELCVGGVHLPCRTHLDVTFTHPVWCVVANLTDGVSRAYRPGAKVYVIPNYHHQRGQVASQRHGRRFCLFWVPWGQLTNQRLKRVSNRAVLRILARFQNPLEEAEAQRWLETVIELGSNS